MKDHGKGGGSASEKQAARDPIPVSASVRPGYSLTESLAGASDLDLRRGHIVGGDKADTRSGKAS